MLSSKADIIARLQKELLPLQGFRQHTEKGELGLGLMEKAFPGKCFPIGAIHEFICKDNESAAATCGFISAVLQKIMKDTGALIWICCQQQIFPPALTAFQIDPCRIIFIQLSNPREILWATEEALQCEGITAVISEIPELNFTVSRRFQLSVEKSSVTGFVIRNNPKKISPTACIARWQLTSEPSFMEDKLPGVGHPAWKVELLKVRNGSPGCWSIVYNGTKLWYQHPLSTYEIIEKRKTG